MPKYEKIPIETVKRVRCPKLENDINAKDKTVGITATCLKCRFMEATLLGEEYLVCSYNSDKL